MEARDFIGAIQSRAAPLVNYDQRQSRATNSLVPATSAGNPIGHGPVRSRLAPTTTNAAGTKGNIIASSIMPSKYS